MVKQTQQITYEQFRNATYELPEGSRFVGAWEYKDVLFFIFEYRNSAKLRITYWKTADMVLACARDTYGNYHCLNSNIKTMEELAEAIEKFNWRLFDAKKAKQATYMPINKGAAHQVSTEDKQDIAGILERLNAI